MHARARAGARTRVHTHTGGGMSEAALYDQLKHEQLCSANATTMAARYLKWVRQAMRAGQAECPPLLVESPSRSEKGKMYS